MDNQKNLILAVVFSILVLLVFDTFFAPKKPALDKKVETEQGELLNGKSNLPSISKEEVPKNTSKIKHLYVKLGTNKARNIDFLNQLQDFNLKYKIIKEIFCCIKFISYD